MYRKRVEKTVSEGIDQLKTMKRALNARQIKKLKNNAGVELPFNPSEGKKIPWRGCPGPSRRAMMRDLIFRFIAVAVCLAPLVGWLAVFAFALSRMHRRIAALEGIRRGQSGMFGDVVPLACALVLYWAWPLALPLGLYWLARRPDLAREGRIFVFYFMCLVLVALAVWTVDCLRWVHSPLPS
jgi:hypothetical protein